MAFSLKMDNRTKILAGVAVLAIAGAGAWFFLFQDNEPPRAPKKVVAAVPAKPAAEAPKPAAEAPKPTAEAPKPPAEAPKPAAQTVASAAPEAQKPAAQAQPPAAEAPKPVAEAPQAAAPAAPPAAKPAKHMRWKEDARQCLDKGTNNEIIKCAEAYL